MMQATVVVLATGGTISATGDAGSAQGYAAGRVDAGALAAGAATHDLRLETEAIAAIDSKDMDAATWRRLALRAAHHLGRPEVLGVVVTHGTDTMEETAWLLARTLAAAKPVVLTGAMRPADAVDADGPGNVADAIAVVRDAAASGERGVAIAFAGSVLAAGEATKVHGRRLDAFSAGDAGPLGVVDAGRYRASRRWPEVARGALPEQLPEAGSGWPWVEVVASGALADGRAVEAMAESGVRGIVVACTGNGTIHERLERSLRAAEVGGVAVVRSSRCAFGGIADVNPGAAPFASAGRLAPAAARVELMLVLGCGAEPVWRR